MKTTDLTTPISSTKLNENMYKKFGVKVKFENYSREQLEDYRNLLRTKLHQHEAKSNFNDLLTNEAYQKDKALVNLLNQKIKEMLGESKAREGNAFGKAVRDAKSDGVQKGEKIKVGGKTYPVKETSKPDFLDMDKDGDKKEPMKKAAKDVKVKEDMKVGDSKSSSTGGTITKTKTGVVHKAGKNYGGDKAPTDTEDDKPAKSKKVKEEMKVGDTKKSSTGGTITKTATGVKHTAGGNYGAMKQPFDQGDDADHKTKKPKKVKEASKNLPGNQEKIDVDHDGKIEKSDLAKLRAGKKKNMKESQHKQNIRIVNESLRQLIAEDEEGKAKTITAGADMVNDFTSWMTRIGQYQTKALIEISDTIRANFGQAEAEAFKTSVSPALETALNTLTQCREEISNAVAVLAGEAPAADPMGGMDDMSMAGSEEIPDAGMDSMNAGDEFGASDAAAGGTEISGRTRRESREVFARKLSEAHSIVSKLSR
jgi:hemin uptake protein HemP